MIWMIAAIILMFFFTFFTCLVNVYVLTSLIAFKSYHKLFNYGISFVLALSATIFFILIDNRILSKQAIQIYGGVTAMGVATLYFVRRVSNRNISWLLVLFSLLLAGISGMVAGYLIYSAIGYLYAKGLV